MILVGNQRGGAKDLAAHLMKDENDHVTLHEVRGFASTDLQEALTEAYAISRATKCKQFLFSLSLNPPEAEKVGTDTFENAIDRIEKKLGLEGQPRAIVFHEKQGRRHAHAVWSRIDIDSMKAVQLSHSKRKLMDVSREIYREQGWRIPQGLTDRTLRNPRNFTLDEWQQARRNELDPRDIKKALQDAWSVSDNREALTHALQERGYYLARGDRRGFVVLDYRGKIFSLPKWAGVKTKQVRERLGDEAALQSVDQTKARIAADMLKKVHEFRIEAVTKLKNERDAFHQRRNVLVERQRKDREALSSSQASRQCAEQKERQARYRRGMLGLWDRLRGVHKRVRKLNEKEAQAAAVRDRLERENMSFDQLSERRSFDLIKNQNLLVSRERLSVLRTDKNLFGRLREEAAKISVTTRLREFSEAARRANPVERQLRTAPVRQERCLDR